MTFTYEDGYLRKVGTVPLSTSLPISGACYGKEAVDPWLRGLLPDDPHVWQIWGRRFGVSASSAFELLREVGQDCAGAVQFARPRDADRLVGAADIQWLPFGEMEARLRELRLHGGDGRRPEDLGRFTLAGAQRKTALRYEDGRWGIPSGSISTNRIVKPASEQGQPGLIQNEHFCMRLAGAIGLPVASTALARFGEEVALVIERYDRGDGAGGTDRLHQEDLCQALSVSPDRKYQNEDGPGIGEIAGRLRECADSHGDRRTFMRALLFNFLIAGTDAHAKNYSLLLGSDAATRLAPLYDIASFLPYGRYQKMKAAMKVGRRYHVQSTYPRHWVRRARSIGYPAEAVVEDFHRMAGSLPDQASWVLAAYHEEGVDDPLLAKLADVIAGNCARELRKLNSEDPFGATA